MASESGVPGAPRKGRAIGVIGIPGDRRDEDQREYGAIAATAFDEVIVREDKNLRGRAPGESATNVVAGARSLRGGEGDAQRRGRADRVETILDEAAAVRAALRRAMPGDLVVMCVDDAVAVYREATSIRAVGQAQAFTDPGELAAPPG